MRGTQFVVLALLASVMMLEGITNANGKHASGFSDLTVVNCRS